MKPTLYEFNILSDTEKADIVWKHGKFLTNIIVEGNAKNLYSFTPEMSFGKETKKNITFRAVSTFIEIPELKQEIENDVSDLLNKADFCRKWRNRRIAHFDYELNINEKTAKPLEPANRKELQDVIKKLQQLTNKLYFHYIGSTLIFDFTRGYNGAISLLYYLQDGLRFKDLKYEKKLSGEWNPDDYESIV